MRRWMLFLSTIAIPAALLGLVLLLLGDFQSSRGEVVPVGVAAANDVIVEVPTLAPTYTVECQDSWKRISTNLGSYAYLTLNAHDVTYSTNSGTWTPSLPQDGFYRVEAFIPAHGPVAWCVSGRIIYSDTVDARYEIHYSGGTITKSANQRLLANQWVNLGSYPFKAGSSGYVFLDDLNSEANFTSTISYSAMRFTYLGTNIIKYFPIISRFIPTATPSPGVEVSNKPGFDACILPSVSKMQTWWSASPYWTYGLYLGGSSFATGCSKADAAWVSSVRQQGWSFIPTWVGPQAPCSVFPNKMSSDPTSAYQQGRSEAEAAFTAAASVGLIKANQPTVLYYDLEGFSSSASDACKQAASSFISGWTGRLHELGQRAGGYGSGCSSHMTDWATISNVPDDIWAASWYTDTYDPYASVFGVLCLSNSLWANHQRIHQYAGGHKEVWGSQSNTIDSNIADGEVAIPGVTGVVSRPATAFPSQLSIQDMGWLTAEQGWVLSGDRLLWSEDGGATWREMNSPGGNLAAASFNSASEGWVLPFSNQPSEYQAYHTTNAGGTWQAQSLPLPDGEWQPLQVALTDSTNGWATYRLVTSVVFSQGILLKTRDGGKTWSVYNLPIGEKVYFDSALSGWTAGGAAGNELYVTSDGGATWQAESPKIGFLPFVSQYEETQRLEESLRGQVVQSAFPTKQAGWAVTLEGDCAEDKYSCSQVSTLRKTVDGGMTWQAVGLPGK